MTFSVTYKMSAGPSQSLIGSADAVLERFRHLMLAGASGLVISDGLGILTYEQLAARVPSEGRHLAGRRPTFA